MRMKRGLVILAMSVVAVVLVACGGTAKGSSEAQTWKRMVKDLMITQDQAKVTDAISGQTAVDTQEGLLRYNGAKLEPGIATAVPKATNNGLTYTYNLRKAKWSNGQPVTAQDFVYAWRRTIDPKTKSEYAYLYSGIKNADAIAAGKADPSTLGVTAKGDQFIVELERPIPYFNTMMVNPVFYPVKEAVVKQYGAKYGTTSKKLVYNGPYKLTQWDGTNDTWVEAKNPDYWNAKNVKVPRISVQVVKEPTTALNLFKAKKLDDAVLTGAPAQQNRTNKDFQGLQQERTAYLTLNEKTVPAFTNVKVRQAISLALDRKQLVNKVLADGSLVAKNVVPKTLSQNPTTGADFATEADQSAASKVAEYDLPRAKRLFAEGLKEVGVTKLDLTLLSDDNDVTKKNAEYLQSALEKLDNFTVTINAVPFKTRIARAVSGDNQMVLSGWQGDFPDPITFLDMFVTGNTNNESRFSNAKYDALIQASKTTDALDADKRYQDLLAAQELLTQNAGVVTLYQSVEAHLVNPQLKGLKFSPTGTYNFVGASLK